MLPVEPTRGPRIPGPTTGGQCPGSNAAVAAQNRRMNAIKANHPKDNSIGGPPNPKLGRIIRFASYFRILPKGE